MRWQKPLNLTIVIVAVALLAVWTYWLFRLPTMPFVLRARWKFQGIGLHNAAFSPKGDLLAIPMLTHNYLALTVSFLKVPEGEEVRPKIVVSPNAIPLSCFRQVAFSPDGRLLAVGYNERGLIKVGIFSVADGCRVRTITMGKATPDSFLSLIFAPDGRLVVGLDSLDVWFVNIADGKKVKAPFTAQDIAFSPDGRFMAAIDSRLVQVAGQRFSQPLNSVTIYGTNGQPVRCLKIPKAIFIPVGSVAFSRDGQKLMCFWAEEQAKRKRLYSRFWASIWRTSDWQLERSVPVTPFYDSRIATFGIAPTPDFSSVALAEPDFSLSNLEVLWWWVERFIRKFQGVELMALSQVTVRRIEDGKLIVKLPRHKSVEFPVAFSPDGRFLAVVGENEITLWERRCNVK